MKTIEILAGERIKLNVNISSGANVGSNVSLDDKMIKKSHTNNFTVDLGLINDIDGQVLSVVSNFFVAGGNIDAIMETTHVLNIISPETTPPEIEASKVKISPTLFMAYVVIKFKII
ncbi:MAG: hypothetical protein ABJM36_04740 [Algibacter sp.]|uniref:hypothetical protein n=1 Tax=Algibacter sp. TaxID=1872428 RepID=UPI00329943A3